MGSVSNGIGWCVPLVCTIGYKASWVVGVPRTRNPPGQWRLASPQPMLAGASFKDTPAIPLNRPALPPTDHVQIESARSMHGVEVLYV